MILTNKKVCVEKRMLECVDSTPQISIDVYNLSSTFWIKSSMANTQEGRKKDTDM